MLTPDSFLKYAQKIITDPNIPEEEARTAISRAYYSLYHETLKQMIKKYSLALIKEIEREWSKPLSHIEREQLNALDPTFLQRVNFHRILPNVMRGMRNPVIANKIINFREKRNQADYDLKATFVYSDAQAIVQNIEGVIMTVKTL